MAGYAEKDIDDTEEEQWKPPTEAEMKVIQARRERSDRISRIMGGYLLKGYKMLATECSRCGVRLPIQEINHQNVTKQLTYSSTHQTINLQDKQGNLYCVACEEVDPDIQKDNPALNEKAAVSQRAEQQFTSNQGRPGQSGDPEYDSACAAFSSRLSSLLSNGNGTAAAAADVLKNTPRNVSVVTSHESKTSPVIDSKRKIDLLSVDEEFSKCLHVVHGKMKSAREGLETETDLSQITLYLKVLTNSVEAISALKKCL